MSREVEALQSRLNQAIDRISSHIDRIGGQVQEQEELRQGLSRELDKNITMLAKLIDAHEEQE